MYKNKTECRLRYYNLDTPLTLILSQRERKGLQLTKRQHMTKKQKEGRYGRIYKQLEKLIEPHNNTLSAMATVTAVLHNKMDYFFWTGFYLLDDKGELMVGPYQGTVACIKLARNTGVCRAAINSNETVIVPIIDDGGLFPEWERNYQIQLPFSQEFIYNLGCKFLCNNKTVRVILIIN